MRVVWKYVLKPGLNTFHVPVQSTVLSVGCAQGEPCLWALVNTEAEKVERHFYTVGTGHELPDVGISYPDLSSVSGTISLDQFIGTVVLPSGLPGVDTVIHVFAYFK